MQKSQLVIAAALMLAGVSTVSAASSVDLSVTGKITPAACTPSLSRGGTVDHGKISVQDLNPRGNTQLPNATLALEVNCVGATTMAIKITDNRFGTSAYHDGVVSSFGLGLASNNKKIGWYEVQMNNATADGVPGEVIESVDGKTWLYAGSTWQPNWMRSLNGATGSYAPLPMQAFKADLDFITWIREKSTLPAAEEVLIDGSATLDVVYL
ncbi:DUF1120 domain-containing protein [Pseudomonas sp. BCA14]|uniref:DUF1120 domain-containing protein n=1 Tax=unclassified Pseudomonas TaxID=196821 RepID=UPI00106E53A5|nr:MULTISPECIES: DUF1120 domain-containing protein [unclassified Pseudomonas]TFF09926.1 DUF1120 domain-containing protein [Pseudomonas sp. JMN1]TFF12068.1 DUF1120 domain-containing protein [Pseudomonas sp. BCA17]TFF28844.1 DUF1120 domain-containing protein [Pseudomonas sp. BCA14]